MGSGSSGGGGGSGKVEYPAYLQATHSDWLTKGTGMAMGADTIDMSVAAAMNAAFSNSPYTSAVAYDPTTALAAAEIPLNTLIGLDAEDILAEALTRIPLVADAVDAEVTTADLTSKIQAVQDAYSDMLDNEVDVKVLPKFRRGMQDINAVMSSSFVIGEAVIYAEKVRDIAKFSADIALRAYDKRNDMIVSLYGAQVQYLLTRAEFGKTLTHYATEFARIKITAFKEQMDMNIELDEKDAEWDLKVYQHGGNLMAAIAGASSTVNKKPNQWTSALGGALSGAAMGATMGPWGALAGGILGGIGGLFG